jgi:hypothetical protein
MVEPAGRGCLRKKTTWKQPRTGTILTYGDKEGDAELKPLFIDLYYRTFIRRSQVKFLARKGEPWGQACGAVTRMGCKMNLSFIRMLQEDKKDSWASV